MTVIRFKRTIRRSGGSAAIAVPPEILMALGWQIGNTVELYIDNQKMVIEKIK